MRYGGCGASKLRPDVRSSDIAAIERELGNTSAIQWRKRARLRQSVDPEQGKGKMDTQREHGNNGATGCLPRFTTRGVGLDVLVGNTGRVEQVNAPSEGHEPITAKRLHELLESQEYRCALSGRELTPQTAALDHIKPLSSGGGNAISNAQIVQYDVNRAKGDMANDEFIAMCRDVAAWAAR